MVAVAAEVGAVFAKGFFKHESGEFVERLRTKVRVAGGGEGRGCLTEFGEGRQQLCRAEHQELPVPGKGAGGPNEMLERGKSHAGWGAACGEMGRPTKGEQDLSGSAS